MNTYYMTHLQPSIDMATTLIKHFEGCVLYPYQDIKGIWTIGWGFIFDQDGRPVTADTGHLTQGQADEMLETRVTSVVNSVLAGIDPTFGWLPQEIAAMVSLTYNIGTHAFETSTLAGIAKSMHPASDALIPAQFPRWCMANGKVSPGLLARRKLEEQVYISGLPLSIR